MAKIPKINDKNEIVGETTIKEAKKNGWPRRIAKVVVQDEYGMVLLQKRSLNVAAWPGRWDVCGGHVDVGETYQKAAEREMREELNVQVSVSEPIEIIFSAEENVFFGIGSATINHETPMRLKEDEVEAVRWISLEKLEHEFASSPSDFIPILQHALQALRDTLFA